MKFFIFAAVMAIGSLAIAAPGGNSGPRNQSGADAFREVVVACMIASLEAGAPDPVPLVDPCVEAAQAIWAASYPAPSCPPFWP